MRTRRLSILIVAQALLAQLTLIAEEEPAEIVGSTSRTAAKGYSQNQTRWHLGNIDHSRWDVKNDETKRWLHLNGPQFFTHSWVHRDGPISELPNSRV